jgi:hypothetical protein
MATAFRSSALAVLLSGILMAKIKIRIISSVNRSNRVKSVKQSITSIKPGERENLKSRPIPKVDSAFLEAAQVGLKIKPSNPARHKGALFQMARYLLKIQRDFPSVDAKAMSNKMRLFDLWYSKLKKNLFTDYGYEDFEEIFLHACDTAKIPYGENPVKRAWKNSKFRVRQAFDPKFKDERYARLYDLLCEMQALHGDNDFQLATTQVAEMLGLKHPTQAQRMLRLMIRRGILLLTKKGNGQRRISHRYMLASAKKRVFKLNLL